jgi:hypothetical protein
MSSYLVSQANSDLSNYLQQLLAAGSGKAQQKTDALADAQDGRAFSADLASMLGSMKDTGDSKLHESRELVLKKALTDGVCDDPDEAQKLPGSLKGTKFEALENNAPTEAEWNRVFEEKPSDDDWSVLGALGNGLLTAAKIAGGIAAIL